MNYGLGVVALSLGMTACSGMLSSDQPADRVYWLEPLIMQQSFVADGVRPSLAVSVSAAPGLNTDRLLILGPGARLNHYSAARWPGDARDVLESLLQATLESTGRYSRVTSGPASRSMDWSLELDIREFYTLADASGNADTARIVLNGYVNCPDLDHAVAMQAGVAFEDNRLSQIVAAYQRGINEVSQQLVTQLADTCGVMSPIAD